MKKKPYVILNTNPEISLSDREKEMGTDWLYYNLYVPPYKQEEVISKELYPLIQNLYKEGHISKWFYIRYYENEPHIRLRLQGEPRILITNVIPIIQSWYQINKTKGNIIKIDTRIYEREIERYGGIHLMNDMETFFEKDSNLTSTLLSMKKNNQLKYSLEITAMINIVYLMDILWSFDEQYEWIQGFDSKLYSEEFRPIRNAMLKLLNPDNGWEVLKKRNREICFYYFKI
ncbi:thiopeptide-type bacteriocin biosynthesis protein [Geomicrobium sp. JCM 19055]|uniref:thiopeptide-type bacteriocin biosynthesis protein n=1 Tax=Geomicrobium sp. JCM 19055 TaxID=1460649 RepID=UPI0005A7E5BD|nr:thiopeptide-type bacteriocin biosynthesis protein [Geomicrobium sp. JCM 19055]